MSNQWGEVEGERKEKGRKREEKRERWGERGGGEREISFAPSPHAPHGEKWSSEQSRISWANSQNVARTNEVHLRSWLHMKKKQAWIKTIFDTDLCWCEHTPVGHIISLLYMVISVICGYSVWVPTCTSRPSVIPRQTFLSPVFDHCTFFDGICMDFTDNFQTIHANFSEGLSTKMVENDCNSL